MAPFAEPAGVHAPPGRRVVVAMAPSVTLPQVGLAVRAFWQMVRRAPCSTAEGAHRATRGVVSGHPLLAGVLQLIETVSGRPGLRRRRRSASGAMAPPRSPAPSGNPRPSESAEADEAAHTAAMAAALRDSEIRLRTALESMTDSVVIVSADQRFTFLNGRAIAQIAQGRDLVGQPVWQAFPDTVGTPIWHAFRSCFVDRVPVEVEQFYAPLGRRFAIRAFPADDGSVTVFFRDVTEERLMQAALAESEARLRVFVERAPVGIAMFDTDLRLLEVSRRFVCDFGPGASTEPNSLIGRHCCAAFPDLPEAWRAQHARVLAGDTVSGEDDPYPRADGRIDRVRWEMSPWRRPDGSIGGAILFSEVITERKHAEAVAQATLVELETFYASTPHLMCVLDAECRWTRINPALATANGWPVKAHIGRKVRELLPNMADAVEAVHRRVMETGRRVLRVDVVGETPARPGVSRIFNASYAPLRDAEGRVAAVGVVAVDMTEQRAAEAALRDSEMRLRLALEAGQVGTFDRDLRSGEIRVDNRLRALWAIPPDLPVTWPILRAAIHPDDLPDLRAAAIAAQSPAAGGHYRVELRVIGVADGAERHISARGRVLVEGGVAVRVLGMVIEVTTQRMAELVLARDNAALERLVEARTRDLEETRSKLALAQRMEALGQLAGGIAHDFNNVLQAVHGATELIGRRVGDSPGVQRLIRMTAEATGRGSAVTRRLLAFARRGELQAEAVDPAALLTEMQEIFTHTLGGGIEIRIDVQPDLPLLLVDKGQLDTVLVNIATNARDAMEGTGTLTLRASLEDVDGSAAPGGCSPGAALKAGRYVRLCVSDTGFGMQPEQLARATEPFFTTKPFGKGTGLGLSMTKGFAEQSGGALVIESAPGKGTTVTLWLPTTVEDERGEAVPPPQTPAAQTPAAPDARVLLVDDDPIVQRVTAAQLQAAGYTVLSADSGSAGLALLDAGEPVDVLVTDMSMPGSDGIRVIREARQRRPDLPAILFTGLPYDSVETADVASSGAAFMLVRKPDIGRKLPTRIATLLADRA